MRGYIREEVALPFGHGQLIVAHAARHSLREGFLHALRRPPSLFLTGVRGERKIRSRKASARRASRGEKLAAIPTPLGGCGGASWAGEGLASLWSADQLSGWRAQADTKIKRKHHSKRVLNNVLPTLYFPQLPS